MDTIQSIQDRRSVRKFKDQAVERELMNEIISLAKC